LEKCFIKQLAGNLPYVKHGFEAERRERSRRLGNESVIGLFKSEVTRRRGPWRKLDDVEYATLEWVDWFNNRQLPNRLATFRRRSLNRCIIASKTSRPLRPDSTKTVSRNPGAIQFAAPEILPHIISRLDRIDRELEKSLALA
jgi:hypothetical protein